MIEIRNVIVKNPRGLHLRAASDIVRICRKYASAVSFTGAGDTQADCRSILSIVELGAAAGTELTLLVDGPDAREAVDELDRYLSSVEETAEAAPVKQTAVCQSA